MSANLATDNPETLSSIALRYGVKPFAIGTTIFLIFLWTESPQVAMAGVAFIPVGIMYMLVGCHHWTRFALHGVGETRAFRYAAFKVAACLFVLMSNFPIAWSYCAYGIKVLTCVRVTLKNSASRALPDLVLIGGGTSMTLLPLDPGHSRDEFFAPQRDGDLRLIFGDGRQRIVWIVEGYVTPNLRQHVRVEIDDALNAHVTNK